ncbi:MAG: PKD repeat protein, partial [Gammaproteobacteria bacterium]
MKQFWTVLSALLALLSLWSSVAAQDSGTVIAETKLSNSINLPLDQGDQLGRSVALVGDLNGDGGIEVIIGAQGDDDGGTQGGTSDTGAVYIISLNGNYGIQSARKISATSGGFTGILNDKDFFGKAVCSIGDLDGDGIQDVAVGSSRDDDGGSSKGAIWLLFLNANGSVKSHQKISDTAGNFGGALSNLDEFGSAVSPLGDLDADGTIDLIVGARLDDDGGSAKGAAYVLFLQPDGTVREWTKISATSGGFGGPLNFNDSFGQSVAGIGDLDGDGIPDAVVGATKDDDGANRNGAVWVLFLNRDGTVRDEQKISALQGGFVGPLTGSDEFGNAICSMGDLDGDGVRDLAVGAIFDQDPTLTADTGCVWILFMNSDGTVKAEQKINSLEGGFGGALTDGGEFGESVHSMGDINGDGIADLIAGERFRDDIFSNSGAAWVMQMNGIPNYPMDAEFDASTTGGFWPLSVDFTDLSSGDVREWDWDFGDGTVSYVNSPSHTYTTSGSFSVSLTVEGPGATDTQVFASTIIVTDPTAPIAEFSGLPLVVDAGEPVQFSDLSTGSITDWNWDFGDGTVSTEQEPSHFYSVDGTYTVTLQVVGPIGSDLEAKIDYVVVATPDPPMADFVGAPLTLDAGEPVTFTDLSTGFVVSWTWDFGDGEASTLQSPVHAYVHPGTYDVSLTVSSTGGADTKTEVGYVSVLVPQPPTPGFDLSRS